MAEIRADQVLMGAVVLLGLGAAYLLLTNKPRQPSPEEIPILRKPGLPPGTDRNPAAPGSPEDLAARYGGRTIIGQNAGPGRALMSPSAAYRGRLEVDPSMPATALIAALEQAGFRDVRLYEQLDRAQAAGIDLGTLNPTAGSRWFDARWRLAPGAYAIPPAVVLLWPTALARSLAAFARA